MCGRFTLRASPRQLTDFFGCPFPQDLAARYNIAPTQAVACVRHDALSGNREFFLPRWGLVPAWAKDLAIGSRMINARAETVREKPAFRSAFQRRRCLVAADGYYEWQKTDRGKQPFLLRLAGDHPFAFAGLWERWRDPGSDAAIESCAIITTEATEVLRPIHHRMPALIAPGAFSAWLDPSRDAAEAGELLHSWRDAPFQLDPVSTYVNRPDRDDPRCVEVEPKPLA